METTAADYLVGPTIGQGSFGTVLYGKFKKTGQDVAIKVVDKHSLHRHPAWLNSILKEQQVLRELNDCPYTVNLFASFHDTECVYMVLECCMGGNLAQVIAQFRNKPDWELRAAYYGLEIMKAIEAIHAQSIVHGDIKPTNVLLTREGRVVLADFGSAIDLKEQPNDDSQAVRIHGTAEYASPEVIRAEQEITFAADMWSYGCILNALWTGQSPFYAETEALVVERIQRFVSEERTCESSATTSSLSLGVPNSWRALVLSLLDASPGNRPAANSDFSFVRKTWESIIDKRLRPQFIMIEPDWLVKSREMEMRDGSIGWSAFLME